jgi:hypothetical protein
LPLKLSKEEQVIHHYTVVPDKVITLAKRVILIIVEALAEVLVVVELAGLFTANPLLS